MQTLKKKFKIALDPVVLLDRVKEPVRLRVEPARVEREHAVRTAREVRVLDQRDILGAAKRDRDAVAKLLEGAVDDLERGGAVERLCEGVEVDGGLWKRFFLKGEEKFFLFRSKRKRELRLLSSSSKTSRKKLVGLAARFSVL